MSLQLKYGIFDNHYQITDRIAMPQLECKNLTLGYGTKIVIENLSFSVNKGDYLCIVGENGSGKSTLAKHFNGILLPSGGRVLVAGMDFYQMK